MKLKDILPYILIIILTLIVFKQCSGEDKVITKRHVFTVPIPVIVKFFDTIRNPEPLPKIIKEIDSTYYEQYVKLKDSISKDSLFKDAITIREYNQVFEDEYQISNVYSKVQGKLKLQTLNYETKPRTVILDTTIDYKDKKDFNLAIGVEIGIPLSKGDLQFKDNISYYIDKPVTVKGNIYYNSDKLLYSLSYDTNGYGWIGTAFKPF